MIAKMAAPIKINASASGINGTGGAALAIALHWVLPLTSGSTSEVALTVISSSAPVKAFSGTATLSAVLLSSPGSTFSNLSSESVGRQPRVSATLRE